MKQQIIEFLENRGGSARAEDIVKAVFSLTAVSRPIAQKLLANLLQQDERFVADEKGVWHLVPEAVSRAASSGLNGPFFVVSVSTAHTNTALHVNLAHTIFKGGKVESEGTLRFPWPAEEKEEEAKWLQFLRQLSEGNVVITEQPTQFRKAITHVAVHLKHELPALRVIHLLYLAQNVLDLPKKPDRKALCLRFCLQDVDDAAHPSEHSRVCTQIALHLLEQLAENSEQLLSLDALLSLGRRPARSLNLTRMLFTAASIRKLPDQPGVYIMKDERGRIVYVGKAKNLRVRLSQYFLYQSEEPVKLQRILHRVRDFEWKRTDTELDALLLEQILIERWKPEINVQMEIHEKSTPHIQDSCRIVIMLSACSNQAVLYLLSPEGSLKRRVCKEGSPPPRRLREELDRMYHPRSDSQTGSHNRTVAREIAWRWFQENQKHLHYLDTADFSSAKECLNNLMYYLKDFDRIRRSRLILRGDS